MKQIEITYRANLSELEKLNARLERAEKTLRKKREAAERAGVADWTGEQHTKWLQTVPTEGGWIVDKEAIKMNGAWYDLFAAENRLEEAKEALEKAEKRFEKVREQIETFREETKRVEDLKKREELMRLDFEKEQKEWARDGITLKGRYYGTTPKGNRFWIERNNGFTERSWHCYTLTLTDASGKAYTVFTSGEFWRAYGVVKNS